MPNVPATVDPNCSEVVQVLAMARGPTGREIWLDVDSLQWACSYAADELSRHGIVSTQLDKEKDALRPNFPSVPGVFKSYDFHHRRISFKYIEHVNGLPEGNLHRRRFLPISAITDTVWERFSQDSYDGQSQRSKVATGNKIVVAWCQAILAGTERKFIESCKFPTWSLGELNCATQGAQAAIAEPVINEPAGDVVTFQDDSDDACDGVAFGMCEDTDFDSLAGCSDSSEDME